MCTKCNTNLAIHRSVSCPVSTGNYVKKVTCFIIAFRDGMYAGNFRLIIIKAWGRIGVTMLLMCI